MTALLPFLLIPSVFSRAVVSATAAPSFLGQSYQLWPVFSHTKHLPSAASLRILGSLKRRVPLARVSCSYLGARPAVFLLVEAVVDRKSTRLNSSHVRISYAVFCLKKKRKKTLPDE